MRQNIVLVHGSWHDATCFAPLIKALDRHGIDGHAIDLPGHGLRHSESATLASYVQAVVETVAGFDVPPLVLGHSLGGMAITGAAEVSPDRIKALIYLCAFLPVDGETFMELSQRGPAIEGAHFDPSTGSVVILPAVAEHYFYHDCDDASRWASNLQPQSFAPATEPVRLTPERSGRVPRVYLRCMNDRVIPPTLQGEMAARAEPIVRIDLACGHSPFAACPEVLASTLAEICEHTVLQTTIP